MYIKGLVNTKDQSNACMCEMMSKGSKEALTVLIVTHVTHVKGVERSLNSSNCYSCYTCQKGQKITLCTQYRYIQCFVGGSKDYVMLKQRTYTFLLITVLIFKRFPIRKKFWKAET